MSKNKLPIANKSDNGSKNRRLTQSAASFNTTLPRKTVRAPEAHTNNANTGSRALNNLNRIKKLSAEVELLTKYSSDTVYRLDYRTMKYDYISPAVTKLLGFTIEEMKRVNFRSLIVETKIVTDGLKSIYSFEELEGKRKEGDVNKWQADYLIRRKDGKKIWVSDVSHPWFDESGRIIGSVGSMRDITERVEAENHIKHQLERLANTDSLTGLPNRIEFFDSVEKELKRCNRSGGEVAIMLIDVDNFKNINTVYGFEYGDKVLCHVADKIRSQLRDTDVITRLGGSEFAVVLNDTGIKGAFFAAERIRLEVSKDVIDIKGDHENLRVAVSVGIAASRGKEEMDATKLYKIADTRLYIAKNTGRNQVSLDEVLNLQ